MARIRQIRPALSPFIQQTIYRQKIIPSSFQAPEEVINIKIRKHTNMNLYSSRKLSEVSCRPMIHSLYSVRM